MGKFSLEHKIKDRLQGHEVHVDKQELWKALGIEEEEKDRKGIWFWWLGGILSLAFIGGMWWYIQSDKMEQPNMQQTSIIEIDENLTKTGNETLIETSRTEQLAAIIDDVKSENNVGEKTTNQKSRTSNTIQNRNNSNTNQAKENALMTQKYIANESTTTTDNPFNQSTKESSNNNGNNIVSENATLNRELYIDQLDNTEPFLLFDRELGDLSVDVKPLIKPLPKPRKFELEFFGGVGTINRTLSNASQDSTQQELDNYLVGRDSSESTLEHISMGVSMKYIIGGGFYSKAGLSINRWNEQYSYNIVRDTIQNPVDVPDVITVDLSGSTVTQYIEGFQTIYNSSDWVRYNRLTQIDLPLTVGYEHRIHRWSLFGEASGIINLKQKFSGYLNVENNIEVKDPEIFKTSIGLNFGLNAGVGFGFTPRLRARLSARYYRSLGSVLLSTTEIEQTYSSVGVRFGLGYLF